MVTQARWLALLGDKAYEFALTANRVFNAFRRVFGAAPRAYRAARTRSPQLRIKSRA